MPRAADSCCQPHGCKFSASQDYKPPTHLIDTIHLNFVLNEGASRVESRMRVLPNRPAGERPSLFLDGREGEPTALLSCAEQACKHPPAPAGAKFSAAPW